MNLEITESISELKKIQKKQISIKAERRVICLILLKSKKFPKQELLADYLGIGRQCLVHWLSLYRKLGIEGILLSPSRTKPSKIITKEVHQGLSVKVNDAKNPLLGYWDAQRWVKEEFGVEVTYHWLRVYMIKNFKTKLKSPRKSHIKKDEQAAESFFKTASDTRVG